MKDSRWTHWGGAVWTLVDQTIVSGGTFATTVLVAKLVGPRQFGEFSLCVLLILLVQNLQTAAIIAPMMAIRSRLSRHRRSAYDRSLAEQSVLFSTGAAVLVCGALLLGRKTGLVGSGFDTLPFGLAVALSVFQDFQRRCAFARSEPKVALVVDSVRFVALGSVLVGALLHRIAVTSTTDTLWLIVVTTIPSVLYGARHGHLVGPIGKMRKYTLGRHYRFSAWMTGHAVLQYLTTNVQFFIVGGAISTTAVGGLRAAMNLSNIANIALLALENWIPVHMASLRVSDGPGALSILTKKLTLIAVAAFMPLIVVCAYFGNNIMRAVYGYNYSAYGQLVALWMFVNLVACVAIFFRSGLRTLERPKLIFGTQLVSCAIAVVGTPFAIKHLGVAGGPIVLSAAMLVFVFTTARLLFRVELHDKCAARHGGTASQRSYDVALKTAECEKC